jgi:hypothetical protein
MARRASSLVAVAALAVALPTPLVACGGDDGHGGDPDGGVDAETGVCAGRPCRTSIDTEADWAAVSAPLASGRCELVEHAKYLAPATASAALSEIVFQDVEVHRLHLDFMTQVLAEYFGGLSPQQYQALVQRKATRQYWAGALYRIVDIHGETIAYGFDVIVDPADWNEQLTEDEVEAVATLLATRFHLPLVYAPTTGDAIYRSYGFTRVAHHVPRACEIVACPVPSNDCVEVPAAVSLCGHFMEGRPIAIEHAQKLRLALVPGTHALPHLAGTHTVPALFGGGERGPSRLAVTPASATGGYEVVDHGSFTTRTYRQTFTSGARTLELSWDLRLPEAGGGFLVAEPHITRHVGAVAALDGATSHDEMMQLSSCTAEGFEPWRITATMPGGDGFTVDFRYEPPAAGSGPLFPTRAQVTLGGQTTTVDDYLRLVYAGEHHNWNNQYWVLFEPPVTYAGHAVHGLWIDEEPYQTQLEAAYTLDASLAPLDSLTVTTYQVAPAGSSM